jgi:hypothetical protein
VRQEAVQQALAALKNRPKPSLPMPSKRSSVFNRSPERGDENDSGNASFPLYTHESIFNHKIKIKIKTEFPSLKESTSDESNPDGTTPDVGYNLPRDHLITDREQMKLPSSSRTKNEVESRRVPQSDTSSAGSPPAHGRKVVPLGYDYATEISELSLASAGRSEKIISGVMLRCY